MYSTVYKLYLNKRFSKEILKRHDSPSLEKCPQRQIMLLDRLCAQMLIYQGHSATCDCLEHMESKWVTWWASICGRGRSQWEYWGSFYNATIQSFLGLLPLLMVVFLNHPQPSLPPQRTSFTCKDTRVSVLSWAERCFTAWSYKGATSPQRDYTREGRGHFPRCLFVCQKSFSRHIHRVEEGSWPWPMCANHGSWWTSRKLSEKPISPKRISPWVWQRAAFCLVHSQMRTQKREAEWSGGVRMFSPEQN